MNAEGGIDFSINTNEPPIPKLKHRKLEFLKISLTGAASWVLVSNLFINFFKNEV